jgi:hypothetical protein
MQNGFELSCQVPVLSILMPLAPRVRCGEGLAGPEQSHIMNMPNTVIVDCIALLSIEQLQLLRPN